MLCRPFLHNLSTAAVLGTAALLFSPVVHADAPWHGPGWVAIPDEAPPPPAGPPSFAGKGWYVDADTGDDAYPGTQSQPWKTLQRAARARLERGDALLLKCGSVWRETLDLPRGFSSGGHILIAGWGDCSPLRRPTIKGSMAVPTASWHRQDLEGRSLLTAPSAEPVSRLFLNGELLTHARFPNFNRVGDEFAATAQAGTRNTFRLRPAEMHAIGNHPIVGASIFVRTEPWRIERAQVAGYDAASGEVTLDHPLSIAIPSAAGYFFEGKPWMIDAPGEWAYDADTRQILLRPPRGPLTATDMVEATVRDDGLRADGIAELHIQQLKIEQVEQNGIVLTNSSRAALDDLVVRHARRYGIWLKNAPDASVRTSRIEAAGWTGLRVEGDGASIVGNAVVDTGLRGLADGSDAAISIDGRNGVVERNRVQRSSLMGIRFSSLKGVRIQHNDIFFPCSRLTDCGGIYTWTAAYPTAPSSVPRSGARIEGNFVVGARGNLDGTGGRGAHRATGIYLDELSSGIVVKGNIVSDVEIGIFFHNAAGNEVNGNTVWGASHASFSADETRSDTEVIRANRVDGNLFMSYQGYRLSGAGIPEELPVHALEWDHPQDSSRFFRGEGANIVEANTVLTPSARDQASWAMAVRGTRSILPGAAWRTFASADTTATPAAYQPLRVTRSGVNLVKNGGLESTSPWTAYFDPAGAGQGSFTIAPHAGCNGPCARFVPGRPSDQLSSNSFELGTQAGEDLYLLEYTAIGGTNGGLRKAIVRRASAPWDSLGLNQPSQPLAEGQRVRVQALFRATGTGPARIDFYGAVGGETFIDDVSLRAVKAYEIADLTRLTAHLMNLDNRPHDVACADTALSTCDAVDERGRPVRWPLHLGPRTSRIVFALDPNWRQ